MVSHGRPHNRGDGARRARSLLAGRRRLSTTGEAYAARLREAGVPLIARREQGMVHNFMLWDTISPACAAAADRVAADLRSALAAAPGR